MSEPPAFGDGHPATGGAMPVEGDVGLDALLVGCSSAADDDELFGVGVAGGGVHLGSPVIVRSFLGGGGFGLQLGAFLGDAGVGSAGGFGDAEAGADPEVVFAVPDGPKLSFGELLFHYAFSVIGLLMDMILGWGHKPRLSLVSFQCLSGRLEGR